MTTQSDQIRLPQKVKMNMFQMKILDHNRKAWSQGHPSPLNLKPTIWIPFSRELLTFFWIFWRWMVDTSNFSRCNWKKDFYNPPFVQIHHVFAHCIMISGTAVKALVGEEYCWFQGSIYQDLVGGRSCKGEEVPVSLSSWPLFYLSQFCLSWFCISQNLRLPSTFSRICLSWFCISQLRSSHILFTFYPPPSLQRRHVFLPGSRLRFSPRLRAAATSLLPFFSSENSPPADLSCPNSRLIHPSLVSLVPSNCTSPLLSCD